MESQATYNRRRNSNGHATKEQAGLEHYAFGRVMPQALPLEEAVLGALMLDSEAFTAVMDVLTPEAFYTDSHQMIYLAMQTMYARFDPIDLLTITEELRRTGELDKVGGGYYLVELSHRVASAANIEYHARIIVQKHIQRQLIHAATNTIRDAYEDQADAFQLLEQTESAFFNIGHRTAQPAVPVSQITAAVIQETEAAMSAMQNGQEVIGVPSGLTALDKETGGWRAPDLIIVAARPGMGKSALALKFATDARCPVVIFSLEMSREQLTHRMICAAAGVNGQDARNGKLSADDFRRMTEAQPKIDALPIHIDDTPAVSIQYVRSHARRLKQRHGIGLIIVDYLQLMKGDSGKVREQEVAEVSAGLKAIAKELNVPVIALAQLSRAVETRGGSKRPQPSDLRESGAIENDADIIIFPYRPEYYDILEDENGQSLKGVCELIIAKHRNGRLCSPIVAFDDFSASFRNIEPEKFSSQFPVSHALPQSAVNAARDAEDLPF